MTPVGGGAEGRGVKEGEESREGESEAGGPWDMDGVRVACHMQDVHSSCLPYVRC